MWAIRILSGAQAGQIYPLKMGKNAIGRAPQCEIKIQAQGVSKEHAQIFLTDDKIILSDLNSRNGTFVNGVKIQNQRVNVGDKIALKDIIFDILKLPDVALLSQHQKANRPPGLNTGVGSPQSHPQSWNSNAAPQMGHHLNPFMEANDFAHPHGHSQFQPEMHHSDPDQLSLEKGSFFQNLKNLLDNYFETVAMPGIYSFAQSLEYRWVIGTFVGIFIFLVTALSTVPMTTTISHTIEAESMRRAVTIARGLAQSNRQAVLDNLEVSVSTRTAEIEDGVSVAAIISGKDGHVIAPANLRQQEVENTFFREARREGKEFHKALGRSLVGASTPIISYDAQRGEQTPVAYAIVIYDLSAVGIRTEQTFSLFVETFAISLFFGFLLFFILMKIIEHPIVNLNEQLDSALRDGRDDISTDYNFPLLKNLVTNIGSTLTRLASSGGADAPQVNFQQRHDEAVHLISLIDNPAIAISAVDSKIISANLAFENLLGSQLSIAGLSITELSDPALRQNIVQMIHSLRGQPDEKVLSHIPFDGIDHTLSGRAIFAVNEPVYYVISIHKEQGGH